MKIERKFLPVRGHKEQPFECEVCRYEIGVSGNQEDTLLLFCPNCQAQRFFYVIPDYRLEIRQLSQLSNRNLLSRKQREEWVRFDIGRGIWCAGEPVQREDFCFLWGTGRISPHARHNDGPTHASIKALIEGFAGYVGVIGYRLADQREDARITFDGLCLEVTGIEAFVEEWISAAAPDEDKEYTISLLSDGKPVTVVVRRLWWD